MAPRKKMKTYSSTSINSSVDAFNLLFAKNLTKRIICKKKTGRKKFTIRELPPHRDQTVFKDDSLQVSTEDTFDKLRKGCLDDTHHKLDNRSKSESKISFVPSTSTRTNHSDNSWSPKITRSRKRLSASLKNKSDSLLQRFNDPTNETLNSIEIEVETNKNMDSLSYIRIPQVKFSNNKLSTKYPSYIHSTDDCSKMDESFTNIFSQTFLEKQPIISSTPLASLKTIKNSKLLLKSYEKIKSWEHQFPVDESNSSVGRMNKSEINPFINLRTRKVYKSLSYDTKNSYNLTFSSNKSVKSINSEVNVECHSTHNNQSTYELNSCEVLTDNNNFSKNEVNDIKHSLKNLEYSSAIHYNYRIDNKRRYKAKSLQDSKSKENLSLSMSHSAGNKMSDASVCLGVNKQSTLEDFEKFYTHYISQIHNDETDITNQYIQSKTSPKDVIINLSNNIDVFEKFYQAHYSKMNDYNQTAYNKTDITSYKDLVVNITKYQTDCNNDKQTATNKNDITFPYKDTVNITKDNQIVPSKNENLSQRDDIVVNITRQDNIFDKFYSNIAPNTNGREKLETEIENIVKELVVNVAKCNFENYGNYLHEIQQEKQSLEPDLTLKGMNKTFEKKSLDLFENCNTLLSGSDIVKSLNKCSGKDTKNVDLSDSNILNKKENEFQDTIIQCSLEDSLYKNSTISKKYVIPSFTEKIVSDSNSKIKLVEVIDLTDSVNESIHPTKASLGRFTISTSDIIEGSLLEPNQIIQDRFKVPLQPKKLMLKPGKLWRRSLLMHKRSTLLTDTNIEEKCFSNDGHNCHRKSCNCTSLKLLRRSSIIVLNSDKSAATKDFDTSLLEEYAENCGGYAPTKICAENLENNLRSLSLIEENSHILDVPPPVTAKEIVLRKCGQVDPIPFQECFPESLLRNCHKIGEGVYGEVFLLKNPSGGTSVIKIIPIEGSLIVNGEKQKKFDEILSEIIIALELSNLRYNKSNSTNAFNEVQQIKCVQGSYPPRLLDLWDLFDEVQGSENDCPEIFPSNQLFIVLQLANGGKDLESFVFNNAMQAYAMFEQVALALAVAESELGFEHRDLHWGNVLLKTVEKDKTVSYRLDEQDYEIFTRGVEVAIIDFTLSRIEYNGVVMFNDLSIDEELFNGDGDYQFDIYRLMKEKNRNNWQNFEPYTNILWLHYVLEKAVSALRYKYTRSKIHKEYTAKLKQFYNEILSYNSVKDFVFSYILTK